MKAFLLIFSVLLASCSTNLKNKAQDNLLPINGKASAGASGARYSIKLHIPKIKDYPTPNLSINYSSRWGAGVMGVGWGHRSGASSIHRCAPTFAQDGYSAPTQYNQNDPLCFNGSRLTLHQGEHGRNNSIYRTEEERNIRVHLRGDFDQSDSFFIVEYNDNFYEEYSVVITPKGQTVPSKWKLKYEIHGDKAISYNYKNIRGENLLSEIRYQSSITDNTIQNGNKYIKYNYAPNFDSQIDYFQGGLEKSTNLLRKIEIGEISSKGFYKVNTVYSFKYSPSNSSGRPLLESINQCTNNMELEECKLPTKIVWSNPEFSFALPKSLPKLSLNSPHKESPLQSNDLFLPVLWGDLDFDADGRSEILYRDEHNQVHLLSLNHKNQVDADINIGKQLNFDLQTNNISVNNLRNMGVSEFIGEKDGYFAFLSFGDDFKTTEIYRTKIPFNSDFLVIDLNGDGMSDLITTEYDNQKQSIYAHINSSQSPEEIKFLDKAIIKQVKTVQKLNIKHAPNLLSNGVNVSLNNPDNEVISFLSLTGLANNVLTSTLLTPKEIGLPNGLGDLYLDINGDGLNDVLIHNKQFTHWQVQFNTGKGFLDAKSITGMPITILPAALLVIDANSDGRDDIVYPKDLIHSYCINVSTNTPTCSEELKDTNPDIDFGIYQYSLLQFVNKPLGTVEALDRDIQLIAQANLATTDDIHGDGYYDVISPFVAFGKDSGFKHSDEYLKCLPSYQCRPQLSSLQSSIKNDYTRSVIDNVKQIIKSPYEKYKWNYYTLSDPLRKVYTTPSLSSENRFIGNNNFYFQSSMYVAGEFFKEIDGTVTETQYEYGGATYSNIGRGFNGFQWVVVKDLTNKVKWVSWFLQEFPFTGNLVKSWGEDINDVENNYHQADPGKNFFQMDTYEWKCYGPENHPISIKFNCDKWSLPTFYSEKVK